MVNYKLTFFDSCGRGELIGAKLVMIPLSRYALNIAKAREILNFES